MESLQERKAKLEKEMKEIEALEKARSIRDQEANKNELVERLLTDLRDAPLGCALPLSSVAHVKSVFRQAACKGELCGFFDTCSQIVSLTGKASPVKRQGKANGGGGKKADVKIEKEFPTFGKAVYTINGKRFECRYHDWNSYKDNINVKTGGHRKAMEAAGATEQQVSGLIHYGSMHKALGL